MRKDNQRYGSLSARDVKPVQIAQLKQRFELAEESVLAEKVAELTGQVIKEDEKSRGLQRVRPGEMVVEKDGNRLILPLLTPEWAQRLKEGLSVNAVRRHLEQEQWEIIQRIDPEATLEDVWALNAQTELPLERGPKDFNYLPEERLTVEKLAVKTIPSEINLPYNALQKAVDQLVARYGCRPGQAESMVTTAAETYLLCCPEVTELNPGHLVWLAYSTHRSRRHDAGLLKPVVLTLLAPSDGDLPLQHRGHLKKLKIRQIERITAEAWVQDAVLTILDLEWLLHINPAMISQLLEAYHEAFGVILPTAGTILDMGRTLTHKRIVVELALAGLSTKEIARRVYHKEESVDNYLRAFIRILLLRYYGLPPTAMVRVTGHSHSLIGEHLALAEKYFPTQEALAEYLNSQGVSKEELILGA